MDEQQLVTVKFAVPTIGTKIKLAESWAFDLYNEYRNESMIRAIGLEFRWTQVRPLKRVIIPAGTLLTVDRIYIRQNKQQYDSITFRIKKNECPGKPELERTRFWAKLNDVNKIICFPIGQRHAEIFEAPEGFRFLELD